MSTTFATFFASISAVANSSKWESAAIIVAIALLVSALGKAIAWVVDVVRGGDVEDIVEASSADIKAALKDEVWKANGILIEFFQQTGVPMWVKDVEYDAIGRVNRLTMRAINDAYTSLFGVTSKQYAGREDREVWPEAVARQFAEHDRAVIDGRVRLEFVEQVPRRTGDPDSPKDDWIVVKFPVIDTVTRRVQAVAGMCISARLLALIDGAAERAQGDDS